MTMAYRNYTYVPPIEVEFEGETYLGLPLPEDLENERSYTIIPDPRPTRCMSGVNCVGALGLQHSVSECRIMTHPTHVSAFEYPEAFTFKPYCRECLTEQHGIPHNYLP